VAPAAMDDVVDQAAGSAPPQHDASTTQAAELTPSVLHQESPNVPQGALDTVRGHIKLAVRVRVDPTGKVVYASLASYSPSRYFTRVALETARKWRFVTADNQLPRHCMLWFEFTRDGASTYANSKELRQASGG
jgi:TonB family protein